MLPEEERLQTLADLRLAIRDAQDQLNKMPITQKTMQVQQHKRDLEEKIDKLEKAVQTFSKPKIYVQM